MELDDLVRLRSARDRMDREFEQPLTMTELARDAFMSLGHFQRAFKRAYGETPYAYLMTRRIERAAALLRAGVSVTDACMAVGATSLGSFSVSFTRLMGETPSTYAARPHPSPELPTCIGRLASRPIIFREVRVADPT